jgi:hypothetical protein
VSAERHCDLQYCYACERLARDQAEHERDCAVEKLAALRDALEAIAAPGPLEQCQWQTDCARKALHADVPAEQEPRQFNHGPNCATFYVNPTTKKHYACNCGADTRRAE